MWFPVTKSSSKPTYVSVAVAQLLSLRLVTGMSWVRASLVPRQTSASKVFRTKRHEFGLCANKLWQKFEVASTIGEVPILQEILSLNWVTWKNSKYEKYIACGDERVKNFRRNVKPTKRVKLISESFLTGFYHFLYLKFCLVFNTFHCNIYIYLNFEGKKIETNYWGTT